MKSTIIWLAGKTRGLSLLKTQRGFTLIEIMISVGILGSVAMAFLGGLSTSSQAVFTADELETARNIAEKQMEYVMNMNYATSYTPADISTDYPGYTVAISTGPVSGGDSDIQKITITVYHNSKPGPVITLENYKVQR